MNPVTGQLQQYFSVDEYLALSQAPKQSFLHCPFNSHSQDEDGNIPLSHPLCEEKLSSGRRASLPSGSVWSWFGKSESNPKGSLMHLYPRRRGLLPSMKLSF